MSSQPALSLIQVNLATNNLKILSALDLHKNLINQTKYLYNYNSNMGFNNKTAATQTRRYDKKFENKSAPLLV